MAEDGRKELYGCKVVAGKGGFGEDGEFRRFLDVRFVRNGVGKTRLVPAMAGGR